MRKILLIIALISVIIGCKASPAPDSGYLMHSQNEAMREDVPFHRAWKKEEVDFLTKSKVYFPPVNTEYLMRMNWLNRQTDLLTTADVKNDVTEIAEYTHKAMEEAFRDYENTHFTLVDKPDEDTWIIEIALTEIVPSKPALHALGFVPVLGSGAASSILNDPSAAIEARIRDGKTSEVVALMADREQPPLKPLDVQKFTWYGPAKVIIDEWAEQFAEVAHKRTEDMITDDIPIALLPW